jgi:hypothetical protein
MKARFLTLFIVALAMAAVLVPLAEAGSARWP